MIGARRIVPAIGRKITRKSSFEEKAQHVWQGSFGLTEFLHTFVAILGFSEYN
jgi:hypothetical protein